MSGVQSIAVHVHVPMPELYLEICFFLPCFYSPVLWAWRLHPAQSMLRKREILLSHKQEFICKADINWVFGSICAKTIFFVSGNSVGVLCLSNKLTGSSLGAGNRKLSLKGRGVGRYGLQFIQMIEKWGMSEMKVTNFICSRHVKL